MLNLRILKTFLAVVDAGSVIGAARKRGYSAAAVSRQMAELQRRLDIQLFEPDGRGIRPSAHALQLAERARGLMAEADRLEEYVKDMSLHARGRAGRLGGAPRDSLAVAGASEERRTAARVLPSTS